MRRQRTTKIGKYSAHEVSAHVGRPGPRALNFKAVPSETAHGRFAVLLHGKERP